MMNGFKCWSLVTGCHSKWLLAIYEIRQHWAWNDKALDPSDCTVGPTWCINSQKVVIDRWINSDELLKA